MRRPPHFEYTLKVDSFLLADSFGVVDPRWSHLTSLQSCRQSLTSPLWIRTGYEVAREAADQFKETRFSFVPPNSSFPDMFYVLIFFNRRRNRSSLLSHCVIGRLVVVLKLLPEAFFVVWWLRGSGGQAALRTKEAQNVSQYKCLAFVLPNLNIFLLSAIFCLCSCLQKLVKSVCFFPPTIQFEFLLSVELWRLALKNKTKKEQQSYCPWNMTVSAAQTPSWVVSDGSLSMWSVISAIAVPGFSVVEVTVYHRFTGFSAERRWSLDPERATSGFRPKFVTEINMKYSHWT